MRPAAPLCALLLAGLLSGCSRTKDTFAPRIVISSPSDGGVSQTRHPLVKGYALDDVGVTRITVDGKTIALQPGSRKIANFQFQAQIAGSAGEYVIHAFDAAGHDSKQTLSLSVDSVKPQISIKNFQRAGKTIRISGLATDNVSVAQVIVDGNRLNINPGKRVEFYAETTGVYADVLVVDAAGNQTATRAQQ
ncbi:hypothetical protein [Deinococcus sp.]|uniref:hypothetical protein n=1 Tax=Deinococcus sp. TaxID=47478 RepID=UPI0025B95F71|nr:hypothetical protein [Deinococcus sp.]